MPYSCVSDFLFFNISDISVNQPLAFGQGLRVYSGVIADQTLSNPSGWRLTGAYLRLLTQARLKMKPLVVIPAQSKQDDSSGLLTIPWVSMTNPQIKGIYGFVMMSGQRKVNKGDVPYPVEYVYDAYGRMTTMRTWRTSAAWTGVTWPAGVASPETTTWNYQEATGLLTSKVDDSNRSTVYTYTTGGKLLTRVWARTPAITTTYGLSLIHI